MSGKSGEESWRSFWKSLKFLEVQGQVLPTLVGPLPVRMCQGARVRIPIGFEHVHRLADD